MLSDWILRLRSLVKRGVVEQELDEELRFHFEQQVALHVSQGLARDEAVRIARLEFGGLDQIKEDHRDARGVRLVEDLGRDLLYAVRQLRRSPGFTLVAVLCLGLGIGVNTAIFGVLNSVLLRPMPVVDPSALITVSRGPNAPFSYPAYRDFPGREPPSVGADGVLPDGIRPGCRRRERVRGRGGGVGQLRGRARCPACLGRWFVDDREPVAVISHAVWQRRFNLSPDVLGRRIQSESESYTVAGVAPPEFTGVFAPIRTDIWVPIRTRPSLAVQLEDRRGSRTMMLFGRLRAGVTAAQVSAELNTIDAQLEAEHGASPEIPSSIIAERVRGLPNSGIRRVARNVVTLLAVVVTLVLLIACVNVGNLLLARGVLRQREFAMRRALGASNLRLLRQILAESLVLAVGGGICGIVLASWTNSVLESSLGSLPAVFPHQLDLSLDWRAIAFATAISLAATVLCGLLPAWRASQGDSLVTFKGEDTRRDTASPTAGADHPSRDVDGPPVRRQ